MEMVVCGRGVAALPRWLVMEYATRMPLVPVRLGPDGIQKQIHLGRRAADNEPEYLKAFLDLARALSSDDTRAP